jgi:hypothetical protein
MRQEDVLMAVLKIRHASASNPENLGRLLLLHSALVPLYSDLRADGFVKRLSVNDSPCWNIHTSARLAHGWASRCFGHFQSGSFVQGFKPQRYQPFA